MITYYYIQEVFETFFPGLFISCEIWSFPRLEHETKLKKIFLLHNNVGSVSARVRQNREMEIQVSSYNAFVSKRILLFLIEA